MDKITNLNMNYFESERKANKAEMKVIVTNLN